MKKTYIQPALQAIEMKYNTTLMAGSAMLDITEDTFDAGAALAREFDFEMPEEEMLTFEEETFELE